MYFLDNIFIYSSHAGTPAVDGGVDSQTPNERKEQDQIER
jgi:hypothetical protein